MCSVVDRLSAEAEVLDYKRLFGNNLLSILQSVSAKLEGLSVSQRSEVIKFVADASLALVGTGTNWSMALKRHILSTKCHLGHSNPVLQDVAEKISKILIPVDHPAELLVSNARISISSSKAEEFHQEKRKRKNQTRTLKKTESACKTAESSKRKGEAVEIGGLRPNFSSETEKKVRKLQAVIPGGDDMPPPSILTEAADYVMFLELQVEVLQAMTELQGFSAPE